MHFITGIYSGFLIGPLLGLLVLTPVFMTRDSINVTRFTMLRVSAWYVAEMAVASLIYLVVAVAAQLS